MLTSTSTKGCRLKATERHVIGAVKTTGLTSGAVDLAKVPGRTRKTAPTIAKRKQRHRNQVAAPASNVHGNAIR